MCVRQRFASIATDTSDNERDQEVGSYRRLFLPDGTRVRTRVSAIGLRDVPTGSSSARLVEITSGCSSRDRNGPAPAFRCQRGCRPPRGNRSRLRPRLGAVLERRSWHSRHCDRRERRRAIAGRCASRLAVPRALIIFLILSETPLKLLNCVRRHSAPIDSKKRIDCE